MTDTEIADPNDEFVSLYKRVQETKKYFRGTSNSTDGEISSLYRNIDLKVLSLLEELIKSTAGNFNAVFDAIEGLEDSAGGEGLSDESISVLGICFLQTIAFLKSLGENAPNEEAKNQVLNLVGVNEQAFQLIADLSGSEDLASELSEQITLLRKQAESEGK
jgi:hypothetical protein